MLKTITSSKFFLHKVALVIVAHGGFFPHSYRKVTKTDFLSLLLSEEVSSENKAGIPVALREMS